jgi:hypothetical protein
MSSFAKFASFVTLAALAAPALAHIEMKNPPPLRSSFNPQYKDGPIQDTYTNPLNKEGSDFPCKGFHTDVPSMSHAVATINAGSNFTVDLAGSAVHGGGSCQFSVSYDGAKTFGVIHSIVGNCPTEGASYQVPVPADLPSGKDIIFAWTWFNHIGNREMYMNCAAVDVLGTNTGALELPQMFEANHFGASECTTPEGVDVDFAAPQPNNCPADKLVTPDKKVKVGSGSVAPPSNPSTSAPPTPTETETEDPCPPEDPTATEPPTSTETEDPCPPEDPTSTGTTPPPSGGANAWAADKVYVGGDSACYNGATYTAKWWTMGEKPGAAEVWGAAGGAC